MGCFLQEGRGYFIVSLAPNRDHTSEALKCVLNEWVPFKYLSYQKKKKKKV